MYIYILDIYIYIHTIYVHIHAIYIYLYILDVYIHIHIHNKPSHQDAKVTTGMAPHAKLPINFRLNFHDWVRSIQINRVNFAEQFEYIYIEPH